MEPQLPKPQFSAEQAPAPRPSFEGGEPFQAHKNPETTAPIEQGSETREQLHDGPQGDPAAAPVYTPPPLPVIDPASSASATQATADDSNPATAADDDLIEREWVEKAKKVVAETRNDPHAQDAAVGRLQADYLKKRYGKAVALPHEE